MADTIEDVSEKTTKTMTETSIKNHQAISDINEKVLELMNDKAMIAPFLASSLVNHFKPENKSQFKLKKDNNWIRMKNFLIIRGIPVTLYSNMLTFRGNIKSFKLDENFSETMTHYDFSFDHSNPQNQKLI